MLKVILRPVYLLLLLTAPVFAAPGLYPQSVGVPPIPGDHKPNILILLADDLGYNDSGLYQDVFQQTPVATMPALEALAHDGIRFTRFYTESTCSASRAALLTGRYPARLGFMPVGRGISPDVQTLADYLQQQGYATHHVGKWHIGEVNQEAFPTRQGFDSSFGFLSQWMLKGPDAQGGVRLKPPTYYNPWLVDVNAVNKFYKPRQYHGHLEDILTQQTIHLIQHPAKKNQPWFIYHAFFAPHTPLEPDARFSRLFPHTPDGKYQAMLAQLDENVGKIILALKESDQWDNTIIIFASDNGSPEKHGHSNAPFAGGKAEYEEGGIRTPLVIKWQKSLQASTQSPAQRTRKEVVSIMDIYPSLVSALSGASVEDNSFDGTASLLAEKPVYSDKPHFFLSFGGLSVLSADGDWRLFKQWENAAFTSTQWFKYSKLSIPDEVKGGFFEKKRNNGFFNDFLTWRDGMRMVPLAFTAIGNTGAGKLTGSDFLRTPLNPSFAIAFAFSADAIDKKQTLLYQEGTTEVTLQKGILLANINGLIVRERNIQPGQCYSVVLSGEFYDRFSGVQGEIRPSRLHLVVNGVEVASATKAIASFEKIQINAPTFVGVQDGKAGKVFDGKITEPKIFLTQLLPNDEPIPSGIEQVLKGMCP